MKRGVVQHPKFESLMRSLGISKRETVGILELLWHCTEQFHDDGGIGRWSDANIAGAMDWHGGDARQLVRTLIEMGWIDEVRGEPVRLVVHDWLSHAPNHVWSRVKKRVERALKSGSVPEWLCRQYERAKMERNKDQSDFDDGEGLLRRDVRLRPAASDPNPRPKTQDQPSDPGSDGDGVTADADRHNTQHADGVLNFLCNGKPPAWTLTADHLARLVEQWPSVRVFDCLASLSKRQVDEVTLRKTAKGMPNYLQNWLRLEVERYRKFVHVGERNHHGKVDVPPESLRQRTLRMLEAT